MAVRLSASGAGHLLPPWRFLVLISVRGWVNTRDTVQLKGLGQLRNPIISSGIEPATFRLVALCLDQLRYHVPLEPRIIFNLSLTSICWLWTSVVSIICSIKHKVRSYLPGKTQEQPPALWCLLCPLPMDLSSLQTGPADCPQGDCMQGEEFLKHNASTQPFQHLDNIPLSYHNTHVINRKSLYTRYNPVTMTHNWQQIPHSCQAVILSDSLFFI
jgi:hypothetical protein